jgi:hypothetical protein
MKNSNFAGTATNASEHGRLIDHDHCWHGRSSSLGSDGTKRFSTTHSVCCHCGEQKFERSEWQAQPPKEHGPYASRY